MERNNNNNSGALTLEAMVCVLSFMLFTLTLSGLFSLFMMRNASAHALMEATESLSLDAYVQSVFNESYDIVGSGENEKAVTLYGNIGDMLVKKIFGGESKNPYFTSELNTYWADEKVSGKDLETVFEKNDPDQKSIVEVAKNIYIGYLAGNSENAAAFLKLVQVKDGIDGLDFSESYVENGVLTLTVKYEINYPFKLGTLSSVPVTQSARAKLWTN